MVLILAAIVSFAPFIALYLWLRKMLGEERREISRNALNHGFLCIFPVVLFSAVFNIVLKLTGLKDAHPLAYEACYTFIVLAFAEELVKYLMFRRVLKRRTCLCHGWM